MALRNDQAFVPRVLSPPDESARIHCDPTRPLSGLAATLKGQVENWQRFDNRRFSVTAVVFFALSVLFLIWMVVPSGRRLTDVVDNVIQLLSGLVAVAMCAEAARRRKQWRTGWGLLAASLFIVFCGNAIWCYYNLVLRGELNRSSLAADVCTVLALPLAVGGVLTIPGALRTSATKLQGLLDAMLVSSAMFFIGWTLLLAPVYRLDSGGLATEIFNLAYPSSEIVMASLVIILATSATRGNRMSLGLVSAGFLSCIVADSLFSYLTAVHRYTIGNTTDLGWVLGYFLIALGALWACNHLVVPCEATARGTVRSLVGQNLPLLGVVVTAAWQMSVRGSLDRMSQVGFIAVVLIMAARQFYVLRDHIALGHQLEVKVEQRTSELRHQAFHDTLTGLGNRALFNQYLETAVRSRQGTCSGLAVVLIDLHNFKRVNDLQGHEVGDELLRLVAVRLQEILLGVDTLARVGGDEFGLLVQGQLLGRGIEHVADLVTTTLRRPFSVGSSSLVVEAAIGLAVGGPEQTSGDELLRNASLALSAAKARDGHCYEVYSPLMHSSILEGLKTESDLRKALERDELVVYYQPVVDIPTVTIQGVEALVRWNHPTRGILGPDKFIPVAEATGIIGAIGAWVLRQACRDIAAMDRADPPLWVSVNLSALQLQDENLVDTVSQGLEDSGLEATRLTLEVTETVIMNDVPRSIQALTALRNVGVKIAIDDFGTGYSSLGALRYLPVDTLKIDRSFVIDLARDKASADLTRRTLQLAADFRLRTATVCGCSSTSKGTT
jgi:diguanylate cyclase (GGDEF)-like protein